MNYSVLFVIFTWKVFKLAESRFKFVYLSIN